MSEGRETPPRLFRIRAHATVLPRRGAVGTADALPTDIQRAFRKARERAALAITDAGEVVFHSLRHTGISRLANHPAIPFVHVRDFARHSDLATTQGYVHGIDSATVSAAIGEALAGQPAGIPAVPIPPPDTP